MKAEITATGTLVLTPENGVEAYALMHWVRDAEQPPAPGRPRAVTIDLSLFPETLRIESGTRQWTQEERDAWARSWRDAPTSGGTP